MGLIPCKSPHPPGVIGVITAELSRYPDFTKCLERLMVPEGTTWEWVEGIGFARNRNEIIGAALKKDAQWIWFVDDDNTFQTDVLMRLLDRNVDIIQPLICNRKPPYNMHAYDIYMRSADSISNGIEYIPAQWNDIPEHGLSEWGAVSSGGMLIRRSVLDNLEYPWFEEGKTKRDEPGEDLYFCKKATEAGFHVWLDSDVEMGHMTKTTIYPRRMHGAWVLDFEMSRNHVLTVPIADTVKV